MGIIILGGLGAEEPYPAHTTRHISNITDECSDFKILELIQKNSRDRNPGYGLNHKKRDEPSGARRLL
jgi:hypothetical protein